MKGTIHWVSVEHAIDAEIRLYDRLFTVEDPLGHKEKDYKGLINPHSLDIVKNCKLEPSLSNAEKGERFQFERLGYFCVDSVDSSKEQLVFNRIVTLRDTWSKIEKAQKK